jgi:hypothetical protein
MAPVVEGHKEVASGDTKQVVAAAAPEDAPNGAPAEQAPTPAKRRRGSWLKPLLLFGVAVLSAIVAFYAYPRDSPIAASGGVSNIHLNLSAQPVAISVMLIPASSGVSVDVFVAFYDKPPGNQPGQVEFDVPPSAWGGPGRCPPPQVAACYPGSVRKVMLVNFSRYRSQQGDWTTDASLTVPDAGYNAATNPAHVAVLLPQVTLDFSDSVILNVVMSIPGLGSGGYAWTTSAGAVPTTSGDSAVWSTTTGATETTTGDNAVSVKVQDDDNKLFFIAGALLAIAGGALLSAILELIR